MPGAGVRLVRGAQELVGSAAFCSRPATVGRDKVEQATPEAAELQRNAVPLGSARYRLIRSRMSSGIVRVCTEVAREVEAFRMLDGNLSYLEVFYVDLVEYCANSDADGRIQGTKAMPKVAELLGIPHEFNAPSTTSKVINRPY